MKKGRVCSECFGRFNSFITPVPRFREIFQHLRPVQLLDGPRKVPRVGGQKAGPHSNWSLRNNLQISQGRSVLSSVFHLYKGMGLFLDA